MLVVQMPSEPSVIRFYVALLAAMGAHCDRAHGCRKWNNWRWHCCARSACVLVIDELHNVLAGNSVNRREFLNLLRFLGNELRIPLVGSARATPTWPSAR